jgi:hypothetical protein
MGHALAFFLLVAAAVGAPAPCSGTLGQCVGRQHEPYIGGARIAVDLIDFVEAATRLGSVCLADLITR